MTEAQWALVQLLDGVQRHDLPNQLGLPDDEIDRICSAYESARTALAQPKPEGPTRDEAVAVYTEVMAAHDCQTLGDMAEHFARAILARFGGHPAPVPVSERLPGPEDCDALGDCWWYSEEYGWELQGRLGESTHWLPVHALPLPLSEDV